LIGRLWVKGELGVGWLGTGLLVVNWLGTAWFGTGHLYKEISLDVGILNGPALLMPISCFPCELFLQKIKK
jgi:hypothetical protein